MSAAVRLYARLLRLLPRRLRDGGADDMLLTFRDRHAEAVRQRRTARFVVREVLVLLRVVLSERIMPRPADVNARRHLLDPVLSELRHATRRLARTPGFTTAVLLTLSLAVAANITIFTLVHRVVIAPLPWPESDRLVQLEHAAPGAGIEVMPGISTGLYREYASVAALEAMGAYQPAAVTADLGAGPERTRKVALTQSMGTLLGASPLHGRWFGPDDGGTDGHAVAILTWDFWTTRYGADPRAIGNTLRIDGVVHEIVGVMPEGFAFPDRQVELLTPMRLDPARAVTGGMNMMALGRLRADVTMTTLRTQLNEVVQSLPERFPEHASIIRTMVDEAGLAAVPILYRDRVVGGVQRTLWVLFAAVSLLLLIAFANLANLFLVRGEARQREVAMRRALGAGTARVAGHYLAETMVIAAAGGVLGLVMANVAVQYIATQGDVPLPRLHEVRLDAMSALYALALTTCAGFGFALMQLLRRTRPLYATLQDAARGTAGRTRMHGRRVLVVAQVSLAVMLLVAAGLMIQSFVRLQRVDPGFSPGDALVFTVTLPSSQYAGRESAARFHYELLERVRALAGVRAAAITTTLPLGGDGWGDPLEVRGAVDQSVNVVARSRRVSADFFATLGVPLRAGRLLDEHDERARRNVAVINQALADAYFPGEEPLGRMIREIGRDGDDEWFEVLGVVGNTATHSLAEATPLPKLYVPLMTTLVDDTPPIHTVSYVLRTDGPPLALLPAVRAVLRDLDPTLAAGRAESLDDIRARAAAGTAFTMLLLIIASVAALLLGIIGVYGVIAYAVAHRTAEIGVRIALGAQPGAIAAMIVRQSALTIALGVGVGVVGAAAAARTLQSLLFGVQARDPLTFVAVASLLFAIGLAASWIPARRAARVSPLASLLG